MESRELNLRIMNLDKKFLLKSNQILVTYGVKYSRMDEVKFVEADHIPSNFLKAVFHKFTWSILECFVHFLLSL